MLRPTPTGILLTLLTSIACTSAGHEVDSKAEPKPDTVADSDANGPKSPPDPGSYATRHSCLGGGGAQCPDGLLCVSIPGSSGGRCEDRPRGAVCGDDTCTAREMCCEGLCMQAEAKAICRPGRTERGAAGTRCNASEPCVAGLACVSTVEGGAGHCTLSTGEGSPPTRTHGPCKSDADCLAFVNCDCGCEPRLASVPVAQGEAWMTMCNGQPPPNCGVASPCMNFEASCDGPTATCVVRPGKPAP